RRGAGNGLRGRDARSPSARAWVCSGGSDRGTVPAQHAQSGRAATPVADRRAGPVPAGGLRGVRPTLPTGWHMATRRARQLAVPTEAEIRSLSRPEARRLVERLREEI